MNIAISLIFLFKLLYVFTDDEEQYREELKDLIDDNPIEEDEESGDSEDGSGEDGGGEKRKKHDEDFDDGLEEEDYDLLEENLGRKIERRVRQRLIIYDFK